MIHTFPHCVLGPFPCCLAKIRRDEILSFILASFHQPEQWAGICKILFYCSLISPRTFSFRFSRSFLLHMLHLLENLTYFRSERLLCSIETIFSYFDVFAIWNGKNFFGKQFSPVNRQFYDVKIWMLTMKSYFEGFTLLASRFISLILWNFKSFSLESWLVLFWLTYWYLVC